MASWVPTRLSSGQTGRTVRVGPLSGESRAAPADLLGMERLPGEFAQLRGRDLDEVLAAAVGASVTEVVTQLVGPLDNRARRRQEAKQAKKELWEWLANHDVVKTQPALQVWVGQVRQAGVTGSTSRTEADLRRALDVLARLPATGTPLAMLAEEVLGDPHGLDDGTRCAGLVLRALTAIYEVEPPADAPARRALWERAGVADDELSPVVLVAGLRPAGDAPGNRVLAACADSGDAAALTLRLVRTMAVQSNLPETVWAFENPSVLALATARFGREFPPVVCTAGWPNSAAILLLQRLRMAGCRLNYHGDFDGEGVRIAANVLARTGATAWRMNASDYLRALSMSPSGNPVGRMTEAPWDAELAAQMRRHDRTVSEERVADELLDELAVQ